MEQHFPFQSSQLPYSYVALMPHCDANTLYYHHDQYYAESVYELNNLAVRHRLTHLSLSQLLTEDLNLPTAQLNRLRNAAGSVYNHQIYFDGLNCKAGQPPFNRLTDEITTTYGSMSRFQQLLIEAAESIIGSGWVWLVAEGDKGIHIVTTANNEVVDLAYVSPLLILDMWEHAYLTLDHFNIPHYVETWFALINWDLANAKYMEASGTNGTTPQALG